MVPSRVESPRLIIGEGAIERIPLICQELDVKRPLIVTGPKTRYLAAERAKSLLGLKEDSMAVVRHGQVNSNLIQELITKTQQNDMIIAVGGGRIIDVGKALATTRHYMAVPTALSNDGLVSPFCSVRTSLRVYSLEGKVPEILLIDTGVVLSAPQRLWAAGFADLLSKKSSHYDWVLASELGVDEFNPYAASFVESVGTDCLSNHAPFFGEGLERVVFMVSNIMLSGLATSIHDSTRPVSGSEHKIAHRLYQLCSDGVLHGELVALGTVVSLCIQDQDWKEAVDVLIRVGAPITAAELGISDELMVEAVLTADRIRPKRHTILEESRLTRQGVLSILRRVGVIGENN